MTFHSHGASRHQSDHHSIPEHRIRERAYEIYVLRGSKGGHADGDWLTAEAELRELEKKAAETLAALESLTGKA